MHKTKPYKHSVSLFHRERGKVYTFEDINDAAHHLTWIQSLGKIGEYFTRHAFSHWYDSKPVYYFCDLILRDDLGDVVTEEKLFYIWKSQNRKKWLIRWSKQAWGGHRSIRTHQERKWANAHDDEEFAPKPRGKRNKISLPTSWDDVIAHSDKSWKTQSKRKHQWKSK